MGRDETAPAHSGRKLALIVAVVLLLDQAVKLLVKLTMQPGDSIDVLGKFFQLSFVENDGAAFGVTLKGLLAPVADISDYTAKVLLTGVSLVLVAFLVRFLYSVRTSPTSLPVWVALVLGGALGNITDRVFYGLWFNAMNDYEGGVPFVGWVVDMFYIHIWQGPLPAWMPLVGGSWVSLWPVFNIADACITVGILVIILFQRRLFRTAAASPAQPVAQGLASPEVPQQS